MATSSQKSRIPNTYLGVNITNNLSWSLHTAVTAKKANQVLGFLKRNLRGAPARAKELAYYTMVRSVMEYSCAIWDPYQKKDIDAIEKIQRRSARFVRNKFQRQESVTKLLKDLGWDLMESRREHQRLTLIFKIINGEMAVPAGDVDLKYQATRTRAANNRKLKTLRTSTEAFKNSTIPRTIPGWNSLPQDIINCESTGDFKTSIRLRQ